MQSHETRQGINGFALSTPEMQHFVPNSYYFRKNLLQHTWIRESPRINERNKEERTDSQALRFYRALIEEV